LNENLVFEIINGKFASSINYDEYNVSKQSQKYSGNENVDKQSKNTHV